MGGRVIESLDFGPLKLIFPPIALLDGWKYVHRSQSLAANTVSYAGRDIKVQSRSRV